jgi:hypothetical protein
VVAVPDNVWSCVLDWGVVRRLRISVMGVAYGLLTGLSVLGCRILWDIWLGVGALVAWTPGAQERVRVSGVRRGSRRLMGIFIIRKFLGVRLVHVYILIGNACWRVHVLVGSDF